MLLGDAESVDPPVQPGLQLAQSLLQPLIQTLLGEAYSLFEILDCSRIFLRLGNQFIRNLL